MRQVFLAAVIVALCSGWGIAESAGELRIKVTGPDGNGMKCRVLLQNAAKDLRRELETPEDGTLTFRGLPQGMYLLEVQADGLEKYSEKLNLDSALPVRREIKLTLAVVNSTVNVQGKNDELIDRESATHSERLDSQTLESRNHPSLGRGVADAVAAQPGWLMEANGVLHPRGSEYQVQYLVDGVPLTDNRSVAFSASMDDDEVESVTVWTGSYPAEMGRKLGGVVEVETKKDPRRGLHGDVDVSGGSFRSGDAGVELQYGWKGSTLSLGAEGGETARYLDPPALQNFSNRGTVGSFATRFEHDFGERDTFGIGVRHQVLRFLVPNEIAQEAAGQRIARSTLETSVVSSYRHIFSANALVDVRGMYRDLTAEMNSNEFATPIAPSQNRGLREGYLKASLLLHQSRNEWKAGVEFDGTNVREQFRYSITDPLQFEAGTPASLSFADRATGAETGAFVQDAFHLGSWAISAGLRWDRYSLLVHENAFSPRLGVSKYFKKLDISVYGSYDRAFQTPAIENLLLASSPEVAAVSSDVLRLPVRPSRGNFFELGVTKAVAKKVRLNANYYFRNMDEFADDDLLLNTGVSFPIAFQSAKIYGAEAKLEIPRWNRFSGFVSYSYMVGRGSLPATGGLLLGTDAVAQAAQSGSFRISQDQRNTMNARFRFEASKRVWVAAGAWFGSGLPTELDSEEGRDAIQGIDPAILDRVDFDRERLRPSYSIDLSGGVTLLKREQRSVRVQVDFENITDHLNVINFAGLFSGTAVGVPRAAHVSLKAEF
jgi:hypothetical protein